MSNETTPTAVAPLSITRNGVAKTLTVKKFGGTSNYKGQEYQTPEFSVANAESDIAWAGLDWILQVASRAAKLVFQGIYTEDDYIKEYTETGNYPWDKFAADAVKFTEGMAKLADIEGELAELQEQLLEKLNHPDYMIEEGQEATAAYIAIKEDIENVQKKMQPLRKQRAVIMANYKERVAKKEAKAKEAAAAEAAKKLQAA